MRTRDAKQALLLTIIGGRVNKVTMHSVIKLIRGLRLCLMRQADLFWLDPLLACLNARLVPTGAESKTSMLGALAKTKTSELRGEGCLRERAFIQRAP